MMNRLILLLCTVALCFISAKALMITSRRTLGLVDLLPPDSLCLMECQHLPQSWQLWRESLMGTTVFRPDFGAFLAKHHLTVPHPSSVLAGLSAIDAFTRRPGFAQLFAGHVIITVSPIPVDANDQASLLRNRLLVLREIDPPTDVRHQLIQVFGEPIQTSTSSSQGQTLTQLCFAEGVEITLLQRGRLVAWAFDERLVRQCAQQLVQALVPTQRRQQASPSFQRLRDMTHNEATVYMYAQESILRTLLPQLTTLLEEMELPVPGHLALWTSPLPQGERLLLAGLVDEQRMQALRQRLHLSPPVLKPALERLTASTDLVLWTNWVSLRRWWDAFDKNTSEFSLLLTQGVETLAGLAGVPVESFLALFGHELGFFLDYVQSPHQSPRSQACLAIEVQDRQRIEALCKRFLTGLQTMEVVSGGLRIVTTILANGLLQPAYALFDQQLVLADGVELIERWYGQNQQSSGDTGYKPGFDERRSNFFLFLRTGDMVEWFLPMVTTMGKEYAPLLGEEYRHWILADPLVTPMLSRLRDIETSRMRGLIDADVLLLELLWTRRSH